MKIRILRGFRDYTPGQVFEDWPGGMCEILIGQGLIEAVVDVASAASALELAEATPEVEQAEVQLPRKKRK